MADRIKGITIEIGGDTTGLNKALSGVNSEIRSTQSQLKDVERLLKLDPTNTELLKQKQKLLAEAVGETKSKLDTLKEANRQAAESASNYDAWKEKYDPIKQKIDETKKKLADLKTQSEEADKQLASGKISQEKYDALQAEIKDTSKELRTLQKSARDVTDEFGNPISPEQYDALQREIIETESRLKDLEKQAVKSTTAFQKIENAGKALENFGGKATAAGKAIMPVSATVAAIGTAAVKTTADFDAAMSQVSAVSGATGEEFDQLRDKAREMGAKTKFSAEEAAEAMNYMAMAGWKTEDMLNGIEGIMNLAAASGEDLATTSDIVTDALTAFGLSAKDSGHFADILAAASSNANTNVSMMGESFKYVAPLAGSMGYSAEDVSVALGMMANSGIKASQAGTSLRSIITRLVKPTKDSAKAMSNLDLSITNADGTMKPFMEVMEDLRDRFAGLTEDEKAFYAAQLGGQEAMSGLLAIVNSSEGDFTKLSSAVSNCAGVTQEMADTMQDNLSGQLTILKSQLQEAAISIGDALVPKIRELIGKLQEWVDWFNGLDGAHKEMVVSIGLVAAAIGPLLIAIGQMATGLGAVMSAVSTLGPVIGALGAAGGPVLLAVAAFGLMIEAMSNSKDETDLYAESLGELTPEQQANKEMVDNLYESYRNLDSQRQGAIDNIQNQANMEQLLWQELQSIVDENGKVSEGYEDRARVITGQLSDALGIELEMTGNQIQNYKDLCANIDKLIEKKQANALLDANEAAYAEALSKQTDAYMSCNQAKKDVEETTWQMLKAQEEEAKATQEIERLWQENIATGADVTAASAEWAQKQQESAAVAKELSEKLTGLNQTYADAQNAYIGYNTTISNYKGLTAAIVSGDQETISEAVLRTTNSFQTAETGTRESLARQVADFQEKYQEMKAAVDAGAPGITAAQVENMAKLVTMSQEELDRLPTVAGQAITNTASSLSEKKADFEQAGADGAAGYTTGIQSGAQQASDAAGQMANDSVDAVKTALDSHSPSRVTEEIGNEGFDAGLALGIAEGAGQVTDAVTQVTDAATGALKNNLNLSQGDFSTFQTSTSSGWTTWAAGLAETLRTTLGQINTDTNSNLMKMQTTVTTYLSNIKKEWEKQLGEIRKKHDESMDAVNLKTTETMTTMSETIQTQTEQMAADAKTAMNELVTGVGEELNELEPTIKSGFEPGVGYITSLIDEARTWGNHMMQELIQGLEDYLDELEDVCEDIADTISDNLHFTRPERGSLRNYEEWMPHFMQGLAKGIADNKYLVSEQIQRLADDMSILQNQGSYKPTINFTNRSVLVLDGEQIAEAVDVYLGEEYG